MNSFVFAEKQSTPNQSTTTINKLVMLTRGHWHSLRWCTAHENKCSDLWPQSVNFDNL